MSQLFKPKKIDSNTFNGLLNTKENPTGKETLLIAVATKIWALPNFMNLNGPKPKLIAKRDELVTSMCFFDNELYDASGLNIRETLSGRKITERENQINSIIEYKDSLWDAGYYQHIRNSLDANRILKVQHPDRGIKDMCIWAKELHALFPHGPIYNVERNYNQPNTKINLEDMMWGMETHKGEIFYSVYRNARDHAIQRFPKTFNIAYRNEVPFAMGEHQGTLYDISGNTIANTSNSMAVYHIGINVNPKQEGITSMCSVPRNYIRRYI